MSADCKLPHVHLPLSYPRRRVPTDSSNGNNCPPDTHPFPIPALHPYPLSMNAACKLPHVHLLTRHTRDLWSFPTRSGIQGRSERNGAGRKATATPDETRRIHDGLGIVFSPHKNFGPFLALLIDITPETIRLPVPPHFLIKSVAKSLSCMNAKEESWPLKLHHTS